MSNYKFVNVRFNMDNEDEVLLYSKLNPKNRAGNIKKILSQFYILGNSESFKKREIKSLIQEIVNTEVFEVNVEKERIINQSKSSQPIGIKIKVGGSEKEI